MECVYCKSEKVVKNGVLYGCQRYLCKDCKKNFRPRVPKYSVEQRKRVVRAYLNGVGFRAIGRIESISHVLIFKWVKKLGKKLGKKLEDLKGKNPPDKTIIEILEADELFTYVGKKNKPGKSVDGR